jgi:hypothetical protein
VFEVLTRGPFPTGTPCDAGVEAHLTVCPECRRLAEALRPALELFQEAIGPEESRDLPGYWCAVTSDRAQPAVSYARSIEPRVAPQSWVQPVASGRFSALSAWGLAAALALGVALGSLASARWSLDGMILPPPPRDAVSIDSSRDDDRPRPTLSEHTMLAFMPAACFRHQPAPAPRYTVTTQKVRASADVGNANCCTECHNANSNSVSDKATVTVSQSCQICHQEKRAINLE